MSTRSGLFHVQRLGNRVYLHFLYSCFLKSLEFLFSFFFFAHGPIKYELFKLISLIHIWDPYRYNNSRSGVTWEKRQWHGGYPTFPRFPELKPHHQIQFSVILRTLLSFGGGSYPSATDTVSIFLSPTTEYELNNKKQAYQHRMSTKEKKSVSINKEKNYYNTRYSIISQGDKIIAVEKRHFIYLN